MKNNAIISYLFGLLMLLAIGCQLFEQTIKLSSTEDSIELSDLLEDMEEDIEDEEERVVLQYSKFSGNGFAVQKLFSTQQNESYILKNYRKIPVPPPELV